MNKQNPSLIAFLVGGFFRSFVGLHRRFLLTMIGVWVGILSLLIVSPGLRNGEWTTVLLGLMPVAAYVFVLVKFGRKMRNNRNRKKWIQLAYDAFASTGLWHPDTKLKDVISFEFTSKDLIRAFVRTPGGKTDEDVIRVLPVVKSYLRLVDAVVLTDENPGDGTATILLAYVSPLEMELQGSDAPVLHMDCSDPLSWLPVGISANGDELELPLFLKDQGSMRMLHTGEAGSGKSSVVTQQILFATKNPHVDVFITDGKGGSEFGVFRDHVEHFATDKKTFFEQLRMLEAEVAERSSRLEKNKNSQSNRFTNTWNHRDDGKYLLWVWDELGRIFSLLGHDRGEVEDRIFGITSVARSLGIAVIFSSQTFKSDVLKTETRDATFNGAIGFKTNTARDAAFVGFDPSDAVNPVNIKGSMQKSGSMSSAGVFAVRGIDRSQFGRSYYLSTDLIRAELAKYPSVRKSTPPTSERKEKSNANR